VEIIITINTDDYPTETSWFLMNQYGGGWTNVTITSSFDNTTLVWTICVPDTNCYTFTMLDAYGDGICCAWGSGSYNVTYGGNIVASGGSFGSNKKSRINSILFFLIVIMHPAIPKFFIMKICFFSSFSS